MTERKTTVKRSLDQLTPDERYLFDCGVRTRLEAKGFDESHFCFLNRVAWEGVTEARQNLESWFSKFPSKKRNDIRKRFRGGDQEHHGALLELATHEILSAVGNDVIVDPCVHGLTPDFSVRLEREQILVESTVVQESDRDFEENQKENALKEAADSIDPGPFRIDWQLHRAGPTLPSTRSFQCTLEEWITSLDPPEVLGQLKKGNLDFGSYTWCQEGWIVQLRLMPGPPDHLRRTGIGAIGAQSKSGVVDDDIQLRKGLKGKADKYKRSESPFLVITGSNKWPTYPTAVLHALFGSRALRYYESEVEFEETWPFSTSDNSLGSPEKPRKCHVSAVLYKSFARHSSIWGLCHSDAPWMLVHNPWATRPLQRGMFPFAFEWTLEDMKFVRIEPSCTLNQLLDLSDPWPGNNH